LAGERASGKPGLSVLIPAYDEERRLGPTLAKVSAYLRKRHPRHEVLVIDDGSRDGTAQLARAASKKDPRVRLILQGRNQGKGAAVARGAREARGSALLFSDADLSTPIEELSQLLGRLRDGADIAIGSRALDRTRVGRHQPLYREAAGRAFNAMVRLLAVQGIRDTQCGFKLFDAAVAKRIFAAQQVPRFGFDVEALYLARKLGLRIDEVPVRWENSPETKVRPVRDGARAFLDLGLIRYYDLMGRYAGI
jgi:dolichyl-phosphate beta-glucosyltransferase